MVFENNFSFLSYKHAQCLDIRSKLTHVQPRMASISHNFVHRRHGKFHWGPSVKYGFSCFNEFQEKKLCDDFEYQIWKDCVA